MKLEFRSCKYHRNGIAGVGFYLVEFYWFEDGRQNHMICWDHGSDDDDDKWSGKYGVICLSDPSMKFRGDNFIVQVREFIAKAESLP